MPEDTPPNASPDASPGHSWVLLFKLKNDITGHIHAEGEVGTVIRAWTFMRQSRNEPVLDPIGGTMAPFGSEPTLYRLYGASKERSDILRPILVELINMIGRVFAQKHMELFLDGVMTPFDVAPPPRDPNIKLN
ncbi:MAG: hypothetical protein JO019_04430 [Candidatus Kaiserbacteria bacterium]|nr:hypothetical protein [Candidatus Kaiserbacteria bacterium]